MSENLLEVKKLSVRYDTDDGCARAVNGVSFSLKKGETLGLVGETGAGKTTIAKSILQILPTPPAVLEADGIIYEGEDLLKLSNTEMQKVRGKKISMIFQDPMSALNPVYTVGEQIAESIRIHQKVSRVEAAKKAGDMLEMVGISRDRYGEYPHQFSGGMKQRIIIAIALACRPQLLLADEPTTALDVTIQAQVLELITNLKNELDTSVIMITHDLGVIARICDNVAVVYAGQIIEYGTKYDIYDRPSHPYTIGLFGSLPDMNKKSRLKAIPGMMPNPMELPKGCPFAPRCAFTTEECLTSVPAAREIEPGHQIRCFHPQMEKGGAQ